MARKAKEIDVPVDGMHCSSCSLIVEKSLGKLDGVEQVDVDLNTNKAHLILDGNVSKDLIDKTIQSVGFTIPYEEITIQIAGMHCASCVNNVEKLLPRIDGIVEVNANLSNQKVAIKYYRGTLNLAEIQKMIEMLGFEYLGIDGELSESSEEERYEKMSDMENSVILVAGLVPWCIASSVPLGMLGANARSIPAALYLWMVPLARLIALKIGKTRGN